MNTEVKRSVGRPKGSKNAERGVHAGSSNDFLLSLEVGDYAYVETDDVGATTRKINTPLTRRPPQLEGRVFTCSAFTAVSARKAGEVVVLVKIERTE